ncbi:MAG: 23S rRNA (guanosine(2251)-2'-O)-methyltransferase RlmB [Spirochaetaceae bacterium]|nr:MAG: 23S rRNA (guanosine(2251)-2'-O)-methyltransferase RlmB [Spirochaetaceae bacterium]
MTGYHAICAAISSVGPQDAHATLYLHGQGSRGEQLERLARIHKVTVRRVDRREIDRIGGEKARGAVLVAALAGPSVRTLTDAIASIREQQAIVLVLDHLSDPHNLGAILRSADQFGVDFVVLPSRRAAGKTDAVLRSSAGAAAVVSTVEVPNIAAALEALKKADFWIYGADMTGEPVDQQQLSGRVALVLGSEGEGLSRLVRDRCDTVVRIPTGGTVDSLNVSVSAGILLYEASRQQQRFRDPS